MPGRYRRAAFVVGLTFALSGALFPGTAIAGAAKPVGLTADLDGKPIELREVGDWYCDDFSYPAIHCFSDPAELDARVGEFLAASAVVYVTVYDFAGFAGSYMHMSEDYNVLAMIGWNDRISSFRGKNSQSGHFYVDWLFSGGTWGFCCDQQFTSLGSYDNAFSSVHRN